MQDRKAEICEYISTISCMPGWSFTPVGVCEINDEVLHVDIVAVVPDSSNEPGLMCDVENRVHVSVTMSDDEVLRTIENGIRSLWNHEIHEWLRVGGVRVYEPEHSLIGAGGSSYRIGGPCGSIGEFHE